MAADFIKNVKLLSGDNFMALEDQELSYCHKKELGCGKPRSSTMR